MKQYTILSYYINENITRTRDTDNIDEVKTAVFMHTINHAAETMVFTNPGSNLVYYRPAKGKATIDSLRLSRY